MGRIAPQALPSGEAERSPRRNPRSHPGFTMKCMEDMKYYTEPWSTLAPGPSVPAPRSTARIVPPKERRFASASTLSRRFQITPGQAQFARLCTLTPSSLTPSSSVPPVPPVPPVPKISSPVAKVGLGPLIPVPSYRRRSPRSRDAPGCGCRPVGGPGVGVDLSLSLRSAPSQRRRTATRLQRNRYRRSHRLGQAPI